MSTANSVHRLFQIIRPEATKTISETDRARLQNWLERDVANWVARLTVQPTFREHVSWSVRELRTGSSSNERKAIDNLESAIFETAKAFHKALSNKKLSTAIASQNPPRQIASRQTIRISDNAYPKVVSAEYSLFDEFELQRSQLENVLLRGRSELSLVDANEFFGPRLEPVAIENGFAIHDGSMIVSVQPRIHPVGNFIVQCAALRLDQFLKLFSSVRAKIAQSLSLLKRSLKDCDQALQAWEDLKPPLVEFRKILQSGEANDLHDACMILTQVYAAFHFAPALDWLDVPSAIVDGERVAIRQRISGYRGSELFERVDGAVEFFGKYFGDERAGNTAKEEAIVRGDFVIESSNRLLHWNRKQFDFAERSKNGAWDLLVMLANKAKRGHYVTETDVFGEAVVTKSAFATRINRLNEAAPELRKFVCPGPRARTYQLTIDKHRIHTF